MTTSDAPVVSCRGVSKRYDSSKSADKNTPAWALDSLSFELQAGEVLMLVGPNGAGKSTALRQLAGIEKPDRGEVRVFGSSPRSMENRRQLAFLPDHSELFPFLDVTETLDLFAAAYDLKAKERRTRSDELIEQLGMKSYARKKRVRDFSRGMKRRLGLACLLIGRPRVLVLDEAISGLDPEGMRLFVALIQAQKEQGVTVVMASHRLGHAESIADHVMVLKEGRVSFQGSRAELAAKVGVVDLRISQLDPEGQSALTSLLEQRGASLQSSRVSESALEDFLLDLDDKTPGADETRP